MEVYDENGKLVILRTDKNDVEYTITELSYANNTLCSINKIIQLQ